VLLPLQVEDVMAVETMPLHHRDPFDRLIVAHATRYDLPVLSNDVKFDAYGVRLVW